MTGVTSAIVVTFHPDDDVDRNLRALVAEGGHVVVADNGSSPAELAGIEALANAGELTLIKLGRNAGLGAALNAGLREVRERGSQWVCLFDQDSRIAPGFIDAITTFAGEAERALIVPRYIDRSTQEEIPLLRIGDGPVEAVMTSGMTLSLAAVEEIGLFDEGYFIDCTDYDYSTRARQLGYALLQCSNVTLYHAPAKRKKVVVLGRTICTVSHYTPKRRYYIARNSIYILKMSRMFPGLYRSLLRATIAETVKAMLFEKHRLRSAGMILRGIRDARRHVTGHTVKL
ncbi:glycosyltransferase family 2 protein [Sphingomonas sp. S-NIH.Pt15_0812]|uniref:glycosyltransferase family 2 protein n=1 Tax=Sphingomonas sp. S-NIH.Pt15_0812 TaxID=1920129 RepID=UPI000F7EA452|nr:glycosyltransferase family 2 protein [Sphingomonas sp. S-NIH.Pt15_0812]RSU47178.1 hypothetical protein BRX43_14355 [Sphingomonas sp. S-NIH.Pt15_0812]